MLTQKNYVEWKGGNNSLKTLTITCDERARNKDTKPDGFFEYYRIEDFKSFSRILTRCCEVFIGLSFKVSLGFRSFIDEKYISGCTYKYDKAIEYLKMTIKKNNCKRKIIRDVEGLDELQNFLDVFIDFPLKNQKIPILLFCKNSDDLLVMDPGGIVFIISNDKQKLVLIKKYFLVENLIVFE